MVHVISYILRMYYKFWYNKKLILAQTHIALLQNHFNRTVPDLIFLLVKNSKFRDNKCFFKSRFTQRENLQKKWTSF